ncbi:MAG: DUF2309 domain-containing protein [Nannocystaceae bacterium]|nr:DUF2309 domain-containing protein [Nannocystaceae bacterium]
MMPDPAPLAAAQPERDATASPQLDVTDAVRAACARIAPSWPLDRFIAVNPWWNLVDRPLPELASTLRSLSGAELLMPRAWFREAYREGRLRDEHLLAAIATSETPVTLLELRALLEQPVPTTPVRARVVDVLDGMRELDRELPWLGFVTGSVSQHCAAYFDDGQAMHGPDRDGGLYACWRRQALLDRSPAMLMGARWYRDDARALPETAQASFATALAALAIPPQQRERYLWSLLLDNNGWASWCAYRRWVARLSGGDDDSIEQLLAIRVAWEWLLLRGGPPELQRRWSSAMASWPQIDAAAASARERDWLLQRAMELAWQQPVVRAFPRGLAVPRPAAAAMQAVFCIDVRSEVFRRALEHVAPSVQTLGFAGFFGMPVAYRPLGSPTARPQLPGLLAPRLEVREHASAQAQSRRLAALGDSEAWRSFRVDPVSGFTFVDALGVTYAGTLLADTLGWTRPGHREATASAHRLELTAGEREALDLAARCELAAAMLTGMSLRRDFARLLLLVGHGSSSRNNPHAAGLDCGACGGQTGEVNARVAADLLNDPQVRAGLAARGIELPASTHVLAALHDTTTDEIHLLGDVPASHREDVATARAWLAAAGERTRAERAARLGLDADAPSRLVAAVHARARDWSQVRPEWGLADNAALVVAPREHCRHLDLGGRAFLHEYRHDEDEGDVVLEQIMTAPMVVAHWINLQYYASTVDNLRYGSGNKLLHNVVGGHIGVFEGNGGDLRIGLPLQSLHDGARWVHTPLRLSVFIEAPRTSIDGVLAKHAKLRDLVHHGWLSLFQLDVSDCSVHARHLAHWSRQD